MPDASCLPTPMGLLACLGGVLASGLAVGALVLVLTDRADGLMARIAGQATSGVLLFGCMLAAAYASAMTAPHTIVLGPP